MAVKKKPMRQRVNDPIELIRSLDKTEKRYVTVEANSRGRDGHKREKHYLLFDKLSALINEANKKRRDKPDEYLKKLIKSEKSKDQLKLFSSINISRLTDFILGTLRQYYSERNKNKLENTIQEIRILCNKQLYDLAYRKLRKIDKDLLGDHLYNISLKKLELVNLEKYLLCRININDDIDESLATLNQLDKQSNALITNLSPFIFATSDTYRATLLYKKSELPEDPHFSEITKKVIKQPEYTQDLPYEVGLYALTAAKTFFFKKGLHDEAYRCSEIAFELFKKHSKDEPGYEKKYIAHLANLGNNCLASGKKVELRNLLPSIEDILQINSSSEGPISTFEIDENRDFNIYNLIVILLKYHCTNRNLQTSLDLTDYFIEQVRQYPPKNKDVHSGILYNFLVVYFLNNKFKVCKILLKEILEFYDHFFEHSMQFEAYLKTLTIQLIMGFEELSMSNHKEKLVSIITSFINEDRKKLLDKPGIDHESLKIAENISTALLTITFRSGDKRSVIKEFKNLKEFYVSNLKYKSTFDEFVLWMDLKIESIR